MALDGRNSRAVAVDSTAYPHDASTFPTPLVVGNSYLGIVGSDR
jgi:hypothetical protein